MEFWDGKYIARLLWSESHPHLSSNFQTCQKRTRGTIKSLASKGSNGLKLYSRIIQDQLDRKFTEKVPPAKINNQGHHISHFGVFKDSATTPLRIFHDCSCKTPAGVSLNDCLEIRPPPQNDMLAILLRFRVHTIGLTADIEKKFLSDRSSRARPWFRSFSMAKEPVESEIWFRVIPFPCNFIWR